MRALLPFAVLLAGCLAPAATLEDAPPAPFAPDFDFSTVVVQGHDHADPALHDVASGLELVGFTAMDEAPGAYAPGGYLELAMAGAWAFVSNMGPDRGFSIVDVSDPTAPRHVSDFFPHRAAGLVDAGAGTYWDVSVTEDASLVVLSAQAAAGTDAPGGVYLVNVEDKTSPVLESFTPVVDQGALIPGGVHNANPFLSADGRLHVAATSANGKTHLYAVEGEAPRRTLREVAVVDGMHDSAVQVHPLTGQTILYTAAGGVFLWDVGDPARPIQLAFVQDSDELSSYHETIPSNVLIGGRHYTVAATESMGPPTPFTFLDTTDPTDPVPVGQWILPTTITEPTKPYQYSGHNVDFDRGRLYIGHYHAGVWVLDVSTPERLREPVPVAVYLPHEEALSIDRTPAADVRPAVWRATYHTDGLVWATDSNAGLLALRPTIPPAAQETAEIFPHNVR